VRCGITQSSILDRGAFDPTDMSRQVFVCRDTLGQRKTGAAEVRAPAISPEVVITRYDRVGPGNVAEVPAGAVVGATGIAKVEPCLIISRAARELCIPLVEGWALPYGNVRVIRSQTPSLEGMYGLSTPGRPLESITDDELNQLGYEVLVGLGKVEGVADCYSEEAMQRITTGWIPSLGPIVRPTAVLMALEAVKVILGWGERAWGRAAATGGTREE
jgi:molybdopterin/thiamine biosynthesis adenylyltransferase